MIDRLFNVLLTIKMAFIHISIWTKFVHNTCKPIDTQEKLLKKILKHQRNTQYAKDNNFTAIHNYHDYKKRININTYEDLRPYIERQNLQGRPCINADRHIFSAITSGTTSAPKLIPITKKTLKIYKKSQSLMSYLYYRCNKKIYTGKILAIVSPTVEGSLASGLQYGSMSGLIHDSMPALAKYKYVVPNIVFSIRDYDAKCYYICLFALSYKDIRFIATANPSTILEIAQTMQDSCSQILLDTRQNNLQNSFNLPEKQFLSIKKYFNISSIRATELHHILNEKTDFQLKDI